MAGFDRPAPAGWPGGADVMVGFDRPAPAGWPGGADVTAGVDGPASAGRPGGTDVIAPVAGAGVERGRPHGALVAPPASGETIIGFVRAWIVDAGAGTPLPGRTVLTVTGCGFTGGAVPRTGAVAIIVGGT